MRLKLTILMLALISLFLFFRIDYTGKFSPTRIVTENSSGMEVYFCAEDCVTPFINLIESANETIDCAFYNLNSQEIVEALENQKPKVRLVLDKRSEGLDEFNPVRNYHTKQLMHDKFCVIDNKIILTGSFNPTDRATRDDNDLLIIHSKYLARNYEDEFEELLNKEFGSGDKVEYPIIYLNGKKVENYFCPEDSCSEHVIDVLNSAEKSIYFMSFVFTHPKIAGVLINKRGIEIKGVLEKSMKNKWSQYERLRENGIDVKLDKNKYFMHEKVFIIDNRTVITGSFNPTRSGDERNDENILIIHDERIAREYLREFERIWN